MNTTTFDLKPSSSWRPLQHRSRFDLAFALAILALAGGVGFLFSAQMDGYEWSMLVLSALAAVALGWWWKPLRVLMLSVTVTVLVACWAYWVDGRGDLSMAESRFILKYFLSSQTALMWMSVLFFSSTVLYWVDLLKGQRSGRVGVWASRTAWAGVFMALVGSFVRWFESHQMGTGMGHIPVSNLYEVFVLFAWLTTLMYLQQEHRYRTRRMGPWVMLVISAAVGFLVWYSLTREAHVIQPLIPALQSWWMKIHVPANFVGYGGFAIAAMLAAARLLVSGLTPEGSAAATGSRAAWLARLPEVATLDDAMYRAIAVGFAFFTLATILGALWAAEAWGGYWSWDPKETWALIVWLNYAAWLHIRMLKGSTGRYGTVASWWALVGLVVTTFAFIGVNMFLGGLHSYGEL